MARNLLGEMPFLDHLEELRWRIFRSLAAIVVGTVVGYVVVQHFGVLELLIRPSRAVLGDKGLAYFHPMDPFLITLKLSLVVGLILALPFVVREVWGFLSPGLTREERRVIVPSLYFGLLLFLSGVAIAYFFVLPITLSWGASFQSEFLTANIEVGQYLGFVTQLLVGFGAAFELPIVVMILSVMGLVTPRFMREKRRHAIVIITVVVAVVTPGDLITTFTMLVPVLILYELSIFLSALVHRRKERAEKERMQPAEGPPPGAVGADGP
ncbi:MAG: twin-arginine translocase subunit TatC [Gemmatimonadetes bacterium]|nr:twin-arginine translocase subunit TatC [Gemmatimonadota bacterium]